MALIKKVDTLTVAARSSFPPQFCRILATREQGDRGYVLFDTAPEGSHYLYGVHYDRRDGRWSEGSSSNGPGWSRDSYGSELGTLSVWGDAPAGADRVRIESNGEIREESVEGGIYLLVWFGVPIDADPTVGRRTFRINGHWQ
jgi:hypothetical protein